MHLLLFLLVSADVPAVKSEAPTLDDKARSTYHKIRADFAEAELAANAAQTRMKNAQEAYKQWVNAHCEPIVQPDGEPACPAVKPQESNKDVKEPAKDAKK